MKRTLKILLAVSAVLVVLLIVGVVALYLSLGRLVKTGVETLGPTFTGAPVKVESVSFSAFSGKVRIKGVDVANPAGFKSPSAFRLGEIRVQVAPGSIFTDTVVVKEIFIDAPEVTYEMGLKGSNVGKIQENVEAATGGGQAAPTPAAKPAGPGKKVIIEDLQVQNGKVRVADAIVGAGITVPLPPVHMKDIGKDTQGASVGEAVEVVIKSVTAAVTGAATGTVDAAKKAAAEVGGAVRDTGKAVGEKASGIGKSIGGLFKKD